MIFSVLGPILALHDLYNVHCTVLYLTQKYNWDSGSRYFTDSIQTVTSMATNHFFSVIFLNEFLIYLSPDIRIIFFPYFFMKSPRYLNYKTRKVDSTYNPTVIPPRNKPENIEWLIEDQASSPSFDLAPPPPTPPSPISKLCLCLIILCPWACLKSS
jgi:hypothetical protein